jgi:hypothetical protein
LLTGFETFKYLFFNKVNKHNFETLSNLFISTNHSENLLKPNRILEINEKSLEIDNEQILIFRKIVNGLEHL